MSPWTHGMSRNLALLYVFHKCLNHLCRGRQDRTATEIRKKTGVQLENKHAITAFAFLEKGEVFPAGFLSVFFSSLAIIL